MTNKSSLLTLVDRCEAAMEPTDELLREAWDACFPRPAFPNGAARDDARWHFKQLLNLGAFLDAAMTLVPEGWWIASLCQNRLRTIAFVSLRSGKAEKDATADGKTAALALCAAALRAHGAA